LITSFVAAPAVKVILVHPASISRFEDDLMRIFAKEWVSNLLATPGNGRRRSHRIASDSHAASKKAQEAVEGQNFESRKTLA